MQADARQQSEARDIALDRVKLLLLAAPDATIVCDDTRTITLVNLKAAQMFGYTVAELVGQKLTKIVPESVYSLHHDAFGVAVRKLRDGPDNMVHQRDNLIGPAKNKNGEQFEVSLSISGIRVGEHVQFIAIIRKVRDHPSQPQVIPLPTRDTQVWPVYKQQQQSMQDRVQQEMRIDRPAKQDCK
jgi:PAS domain S-box-containing protein